MREVILKATIILLFAVVTLSACQTTQNKNYDIMNVSPSSGIEKMTKWTDVNRKSSLHNLETYSDIDNVKTLSLVNENINKIKFVTDKKNYNKIDYWATPDEFITNGGDCEDYSIAKYMTLKKSGINPDRMRIAVVTDMKNGIHHAVLIVELNNEYYLLDNQLKNVYNVKEVDRYKPIFHVSQKQLWTK